MCLIPHNLLNMQTLLAFSSLKKVSKERKVSKASSGDRGGRAAVAYFAFFANFANEGGDFICTGFKSGHYDNFGCFAVTWASCVDKVNSGLHNRRLKTLF